MSTITRLSTTGSAGFTSVNEGSSWNSNAKRINMFKQSDLYPMFLRMNSPVRGYILPGFDPSFDLADPARQLSVCPYRDSNIIDPKTGRPVFTDWVTFVNGYSYYGKNGSTFISPITVQMPDPIVEIRKYIYSDKNRNNGATRWEHLVKAGPRREDKAAIPNVSTLALLNVWAPSTNEKAKDANIVRNRVLVLKATAWSHLAATLDEYQPAGLRNDHADPSWPMFLRGDVTCPTRAVEWKISSQTSSNGFEAAVLDFGSASMAPGGVMVYNARTTNLPQEALKGRYDLADIVNVLHIPTAEEIIDLLIEEDMVPYDLICAACDGIVEVMPKPKAHSTVYASQPTPQNSSPVQQYNPMKQYTPQEENRSQNTYPAQQQYNNPYSGSPAAAPYQPAQPQQQFQTSSPIMQMDPDDDIPMGDAPAATEETTKQAGTSGLTPEEQEELDNYVKAMHNPQASMTVQDFSRIKELRAKQAQG